MILRRVLPVPAMVAALLILTAAVASANAPGSHNGRLAFAKLDSDGRHIYSVLPNGNDLRQLTSGPYKDACPSYSADGKSIVFCSTRSNGFQIWAMTQNGNDLRQLTNVGFAWFPSYSPDGTKIAFSGQAGTDPNDEVFVMNADGSGLTALTALATGNNEWPRWSPDGQKIAFVSDRTGLEQVYTMNADGTDQTELTFQPVEHDQLADWSPDGSKIVYTQGDIAVNEKIWVMNADGSDQHQVSSGGTDDFGPVWSPDGTQIAFVRDYLNGDRPVVVMNADGTDVHAVADPGGASTEFVPAWQPLGSRNH
jgi:Tol biopolymer transport system component